MSGRRSTRLGVIAATLAAASLVTVAGESARAVASESDRLTESKVLHRHLDLGGLEVWTTKGAAWHPYLAPRGKILIVTLWAKSCKPCLQEMPELARLTQLWQRRKDLELLLVAAPPDEMTRESVEEFWRRRIYEAGPGEPCPPPSRRLATNTAQSCELAVPAVDPARSSDDRLQRALGTGIKPITLIIDPRGIVRHAFVGSIVGRGGEINEAIDRLTAALAGPY